MMRFCCPAKRVRPAIRALRGKNSCGGILHELAATPVLASSGLSEAGATGIVDAVIAEAVPTADAIEEDEGALNPGGAVAGARRATEVISAAIMADTATDTGTLHNADLN